MTYNNRNSNISKNFKQNKLSIILLLIFLHVLLGLITQRYVIVATLHAISTLAIGIYFSFSAKNTRNVVLISSYIVGAELLWRMTGASVFWEYGKYSIILILGINLLRMHHWKKSFLPIAFFALLIVSIPLTVSWFGFTENAREAISFNLSGPLALTVCVLYFSQIKFDEQGLKNIAWAISIPIVSILTIAALSTFTSTSINFTGESNFTTSGGFGPNQISAILSLGAVMMFMVAVNEKNSRIRIVAITLFVAFLTQSVLTFSRGGLYNAVISLTLAMLHLVRTRKARAGIFFSVILVGFLGAYVLYPQLNQFTNGMLEQRFSDANLTHRGEIALAELNVWTDHLLWGVGPGVSAYEIVKYTGFYSAAHTEYTRFLAEHGIFGLMALILMVIMAIRAYFKAPNWFYKAWVIVFLFWPIMEMSHAAMRISAISFLFGLASSNWKTNLKIKKFTECKNPSC